MPLNIEVTDDYKITSDAHNVIVSKRHIVDPTKAPNWEALKKKGTSPEPRETWREETFHKTVEDAMQKIVSQTVLNSNATSVQQLLVEVTELRRQISAVITV